MNGVCDGSASGSSDCPMRWQTPSVPSLNSSPRWRPICSKELCHEGAHVQYFDRPFDGGANGFVLLLDGRDEDGEHCGHGRHGPQSVPCGARAPTSSPGTCREADRGSACTARGRPGVCATSSGCPAAVSAAPPCYKNSVSVKQRAMQNRDAALDIVADLRAVKRRGCRERSA